jgi:putative transposase
MVGISGHEPGISEEAVMTAADREAAARRQRAQEIALWRWTLVEPAMDPALTFRQRGQVVRDLASREHEGPDGKKKVSVSRRTLDRWVVARRNGGFGALVPEPRQCAPRTDADVVGLAVGLKMENPQRTAAQVRRILIARAGWAPSERAIQRWFAARELNTRPDGNPPEAFGRFEADAVNEIWTADLMNGPVIGGRDCHLSVIIDDRSRFLTGARFVRRPDAVRFAGVLRSAIAVHGIPAVLYCDNGSCYADMSLQRTCAVLGIRLTHSQPGRPMGRGKVERVIETIQQQFMVEVTGDERHPARHPVSSLEELNGLLEAWVRTVYHARVHSETGQSPQARYAAAGPPALPDPARLRHAFAWSAVRLVRKTATVELEGNTYSVDPFLVGRKVELVFSPFDMTQLTVYWQGRKAGTAVPQVIGRHAHPKAPPDEDDPQPAGLTGIDYLKLVSDAGHAALADRLRLSALDGSEDPPGDGGGEAEEPDGEERQ